MSVSSRQVLWKVGVSALWTVGAASSNGMECVSYALCGVQDVADEQMEDEERPAQLQICMSISNTGEDEFSFQARPSPTIPTRTDSFCVCTSVAQWAPLVPNPPHSIHTQT